VYDVVYDLQKMLAPCGPPPVQEEDADEKEDEETK
jgi:hypothetical protein